MINTLDYYNHFAKEYCDQTKNADLHETLDRFLGYLDKDALILDFGCGSGRDTKYFMERGFSVEAVDGSKELCTLASEYTGVVVKQMFFQDLKEKDRYDGIWACSSILHLPINELKQVLVNMAVALRENGIIYTSFKYGTFSGERNGRYFTDMTEDSFRNLIVGIDELFILEQWVTADVRPGRSQEKWLNLLLKKQG